MDQTALRGIAELMREFGIARIKTTDIEIEMRAQLPHALAESSSPAPTAGAPKIDEPIKHKIDELTSLMKLDDNALVDRMFPAPEEELEPANDIPS